MSGWRRTALGVVAVLAVQLGLVGLYLGVRPVPEPPAFAVQVLDAPAPVFAHAAGEDVVLVHFWATWCAPCRVELPGLLAAAKQEGVPVMALTDEPWPMVTAYFAGDVPDGVVPDTDGQLRAAFGVRPLPDTYVVRDGRLVARVAGARDWYTPSARAFLQEVVP